MVLPCEESNRTAARRRQKQSCGLFFSPREMDARVTKKIPRKKLRGIFIAVFRGGNARAEEQVLKGEALRSAA